VIDPALNAVDVINALEAEIFAHETAADDKRWRQAEYVVALLGSMTTRALAKQWFNPRTNAPYHHTHVFFVAKVFRLFSQLNNRPDFQEQYNRLANPGRCFGNGDDEWYTRHQIIEAVRAVLGKIDLDPASCEAANAVVRATRYFTIDDDGLSQRWAGKVWLNPPYSRGKIGPFVDKIIKHVQDGSVSHAIVLVNSDTSTQWFSKLYRHADSVCFPKRRLKFWKSDRTVTKGAIYPSAVFYFGPDRQLFDQEFAQFTWDDGSVSTCEQEERAA
jgi:ParB family chromosome partitioning protein